MKPSQFLKVAEQETNSDNMIYFLLGLRATMSHIGVKVPS
jgi:hypothetical protein